MELTKLKGNTYYIDAPTNIGVYIFKNKNCLLIDTGINNGQARKIEEAIKEHGLHPKYIVNTHGHIDHCGGNNYFQDQYPGCTVYASSKEKTFMENPELHASMLSSASPMKELEKSNKPFNVDFILDYGTNKINDEKFEVLNLKGHCQEHIGFITPEKVCFLGDSIFSSETIKKYSLPFLYDIKDSIETLNKIKEIDADLFVISHSNTILGKIELMSLVDKNLSNIAKFENQILELLQQPLTREDLLENLVVLNDIPLTFRQYHLDFSTTCSFIKYLFDKGLLDYSLEDGKLYYFKK